MIRLSNQILTTIIIYLSIYLSIWYRATKYNSDVAVMLKQSNVSLGSVDNKLRRNVMTSSYNSSFAKGGRYRPKEDSIAAIQRQKYIQLSNANANATSTNNDNHPPSISSIDNRFRTARASSR